MNPDQNTQPQSQPSEPLDPQVVALAGAIGKAESGGNYNQPSGDPGSPPSAYQFTPGFIQNYAPKYGIQYTPGQSLSPADQDKLAYNVIKEWGTTGDPAYSYLGPLKPAQVASAWNTGNPNAYLDPNYGKNNKYGSTENYVHQVGQIYEQNLSQSGAGTPPPQSKNQPQSQNGGVLDTASNFVSELGSGIPGMPNSQLANTGLGFGATAGVGLLLANLLGPETGIPADILAASEAAGLPAGLTLDAGATATGATEATVGSGIMSKLLGLATGAVEGTGAIDLVKQVLGIGNQSSPQISSQMSSLGITPSDGSALSSLISNFSQGSQSAKTLSDSLLQSLGATPTGRVLSQDPNTQEAIQTMGKYGFAPNVQNGVMDFSDPFKKSQQAVGNLSGIVSNVLEAEGERGNIQEAIQEAKKRVREYAPSNEWAEADKHIEEQAQTYQKNFGDKKGTMSLGNFQRMKQETGHGQKFNVLDTSAKKNAMKSLSFAARKQIEKHTKNKEFYNAVMKEEQRLINGQKIMKRLNGKKAIPSKESRGLLPTLLKRYGRYTGIVIGDKIGGPLGAVLGDMVSRHLVGAVDKRYGKSIFETKAMDKALGELRKKSPAMFAAIKLALHKAKEESKKVEKKKSEPKKGVFKPTEKMRLRLRQSREARNPFPSKSARRVPPKKT